jgi:hypothetical protein
LVATHIDNDRIGGVLDKGHRPHPLSWLVDLATGYWMSRLLPPAELDGEFGAGVRGSQRAPARTSKLSTAIQHGTAGLNEAARSETIDELFALTSLSLFAELQRSGLSNAEIERMILRMCGQVWEGRMNTTSIALPT